MAMIARRRTCTTIDMKKSPKESRTLVIIFLLLFVDILAFTVILPLYPRILDGYQKLHESDPVHSTSDVVNHTLDSTIY